MIQTKLIVNALIFALLFSFAVQVCVFGASNQKFAGVVYGENGSISGAYVSASGDTGSGYAATDNTGHYSITQGLPTGTYTVTAFAVGYLEKNVSNVQVTTGQTTSGIDFNLDLSGGISGTITDASSGSPLADILVSASPTGGGFQFGWSATTDSSGKYLMATNLATGSYNVTVYSPEGHVTTSVIASTTAGVETKNVNLALPKSGIISGKITTPDGTPLNSISVDAVGTASSSFGFATTDAAGQYRITSGLATDNYTIFISGLGSFNETTALVTVGQETSNVDLQLTPLTATPPPPTGSISGKVTDSSNGKAIAGADVTANGDAGFGTATTDSSGNYVISDGLGTGTYTVTASRTGYQDQNVTGVSVTVNTVTSNVNFQLSLLPASQSGTITGTVTGAANPIPEFPYPFIIALSLTLVTAAAISLFRKTKTPNKP